MKDSLVARHWKGALGCALALALFSAGLAYSVHQMNLERGYRAAVVRHINDMRLTHGVEPPKPVQTIKIAPDGRAIN
jgi:hypothetical protein